MQHSNLIFTLLKKNTQKNKKKNLDKKLFMVWLRNFEDELDIRYHYGIII